MRVFEIKYIIPLILVIISLSCNTNSIKKMDITYIPDSLLSFVSEIPLEAEFLRVSTNARKDQSNAKLLYFSPLFYTRLISINDSSIFWQEVDKHRTRIDARLIDEESDYILIGSQYDLEKKYTKSDLIKEYRNAHINELVPDFSYFFMSNEGFYSGKTKNALHEDIRLVITDSKDVSVLDSEEIRNRPTWDILPEQIKHGYLFGIAYSETSLEILYWIILW